MKLFLITFLVATPLFIGFSWFFPVENRSHSSTFSENVSVKKETTSAEIMKTDYKPQQFIMAQKLRDRLEKMRNSPQGKQFAAFSKKSPRSNPYFAELMGAIKIAHVDALKEYLINANNGNSEAQYMVGIAYKYGLGTGQNFNKSIVWFEKASKNGSAAATYEIGVSHFHGLGKTVSYEMALNYYEKSAIEGHEPAVFSLAEMYNSGFGTPYNKVKADFWYDKIIPWYKLNRPLILSKYHEKYGY